MTNSTGQDIFRQGIAQFKSGNYQEASTLFRRIVEKDEKNHKVWNSLGVVYTKIGRYEEADECYEKALTLAPNTAPYLRNQERNRANMEPKENVPLEDVTGDADTWYEKGQNFWDLNNFEEAIVAFNQAIRIDPNNFYVYESKARILRYDLNRQEESIGVYDQAIRNLLAYNSILYQKGLVYDGLKEFDVRDESLKILDQAIRNIRQCYSMLHSKGDGLYNLERFDEAIEAFDQAIKLNTELAWVNYCQGAILSLLPKTEEGPDEGIQVFNNAHENFQNIEKTFYLKGLALGRLGRYEEAIVAINQAIKKDPKYADAIRKDDV